MREKRLTIDGMSCQHCVAAVADALRAVDGLRVDEVDVGSARVRYEPGDMDPGRIRAAVEGQGFQLRAIDEARGDR